MAEAVADLSSIRHGISGGSIAVSSEVGRGTEVTLSSHYHKDFCRTVAELSAVPYPTLKSGAERRQWLQSEDKRIVVHFLPFHASWLNLSEIWFGLLKSKCLSYDHFDSVAQKGRKWNRSWVFI